MNNLGGEDSDTIVENGSTYRLGTDGLQLYSSGKTQNCPLMWVVGLKCMPVRWKMR
ncbi:Fluffing protein [Escherichia coli]|uniref:Fluffing protein n=1 Tax=Escherichia coli TaxID=562 RepID=A0A376S7D7_ECOLX|nr:Fluffing protein [Escherichia coli]